MACHVKRSNTKRLRRSQLAGITLIEVLLVLAILAAVAGIAVPTFDSMVGSRRIKNSVEKLLNELAEARVKAMHTGQAQVFKATLNSGEYSLSPWLGSYDTADTSAGATVNDGAGKAVETTSAEGGGVAISGEAEADVKSLEEGIQFTAVETLIDSRNASAIESEGGIVPTAGATSAGDGSGMSYPVMLYPDGSSTTAQIIVADERGRRMVIQLRGITGQLNYFKTTSVDPSTLSSNP